jgi:hypothetical protein
VSFPKAESISIFQPLSPEGFFGFPSRALIGFELKIQNICRIGRRDRKTALSVVWKHGRQAIREIPHLIRLFKSSLTTVQCCLSGATDWICPYSDIFFAHPPAAQPRPDQSSALAPPQAL